MNMHDKRSLDASVTETTPGVISKILELLRGHPILQEAIAYDLADQAERRAKVADEIYALRDTNAKEIPRLEAAFAVALKELRAIEPTYEAVVGRWQSARDRLAHAQHEARWAETRLLDQIEGLADPLIDETVSMLRQMLARHFEEVQHGFYDFAKGHTFNARTGVTTYNFLSSRPSIERRRVAILAAINTAIAMKRDIDQSDVRERLTKLVESIPGITQEIVQVKG